MIRKLFSLMVIAVVFLLMWLFLGFERKGGEHGDADYELFVKQRPGFRVVYENPAQCGECEVRPLENLDKGALDSFSEYCLVRFGLDEIRPCYAIFLEVQKMVYERVRNNKTGEDKPR